MSLRLPAGVTDVIYYTYIWYIQNNNITFKWFLFFSTTQFIDLSFADDKSDTGKRNSPRNIFRTSPTCTSDHDDGRRRGGSVRRRAAVFFSPVTGVQRGTASHTVVIIAPRPSDAEHLSIPPSPPLNVIICQNKKMNAVH